MIDFLDVLQKEVWKKRFFALLSLVFFLAFVGALLMRGTPKTWKDKVKDYVICRFNFLPEDVERAYFSCPHQARIFGYEMLVKDEVELLKKRKFFSYFYPESIKRDKKEGIVVIGKRLTGELQGRNIQNVKIYKMKVIIGVKKGQEGGFFVKKIVR